MAELGAELQANIEAYLLGRLPPEDQARIEALLFEDDNVFEAIRDGEDDLIDRYVAGALSPADREAFEHAFATSASRQQRIALARTLSHGLTSGPAVPGAAPPAAADPAHGQRTRSFAARRFIVPAGVVLAAAVVIAIAWWPSPPGDEPSDGPTVATLALGRGESRRGSGKLPRLRVPDSVTAIRLLPEVESPVPGGDHAVTLRRVEGPVVWQATARTDEQGRVTVIVPVRLAPGDYVLSLATRGAPADESAEYAFRVLARD